MTRENAKALLPIIKAYAEGRVIQIINPSGEWIDYKYKPDYCERTKQHTIREESLFDTEQEALIALFEQFKEKVKRKVEFFNKESKKLGIKKELLLYRT